MAERVVLAMSGGVDSSAAAVMLQQQGYEVVGLFMRSGATEEQTACKVDAQSGLTELPIVNAKAHKQGCCSASDAADARHVADRLGTPFYSLNFQDAFGKIKDYFADEYLAGRTPNPCVMCNNWLKFGKLWDFAQSIDATKIATGHYARIVENQENGNYELIRGRDPKKDQSYVLFGIPHDLLDKILFPVGDFEKEEIRELAAQAGLINADKPDSQEICFIPDNDYGAFIERYRGKHETAGQLVDTAGNVLGDHPGYEHFTIGQRRGLGVTFGEPRFVVEIDATENKVVIGTREELGRRGLVGAEMNWLIEPPASRFRCTAQIRYQHQGGLCEVTLNGDEVSVEFDEAQFGIAPGQAVVFYDHERVLGGGWIRSSFAV